MENVSADFTINENQPLQAEYTLGESEHFDCTFELFASGTVWGSIDGNIENQTDLWEILNSKADTETVNHDLEVIEGEISDLSYTVDNNYTTLVNRFENDELAISNNTNEITSINNTILTYGDIVTYNASNFATSAQGALADSALQPNDNISELTNDVGYITSASLPIVNNATLTIQKNSVDIDMFTANASVDKIINISVPVNASDVNALPDITKYGASIDVALNTTDYKLTISLKDQDGTVLNSKVVDFPIESVVVNGSYDNVNQKIILTLQNGNTIEIPVGGLIAGLQTEITSTNKLDADLVDDSTSTNKFVTTGDKITWNGKQDAISDLATIRSNAINGQSAYTTISGYGNIVTHNVSEFATSAQGALADTALQPNDNVSDLVNDAGYITSASLPTVNNGTLDIQVNGTSVGTFTANQAGNTTANIVVPDSATWGNITGTLSNQTDLQNALNNKYDASNPNGYTSNVGTVTSVNNTQPDANGNVTIPTGGTVDQTYSPNSANAQSGVAIAGAKFLQNTATGNSSITVNGTATAKSQAINIGTGSQATGNYGTALGVYSSGNASHALGLGNYAKATADYAIQLNKGTNNTSNSLCVGFNSDNYQLLDGTTGLIPDARLSSNIARTSQIPSAVTESTVSDWGFTKNAGTVTSVNNVSPVSGNVALSIPTATSDLTNDSGFITSSDLPTNYVTTDTTQNITGTKTFVGQKKIAFKQSGTSDKLGFTLYNNSGTEKGYLEYNPSNNVDGVPLMTLGNYATASGGLTHVGFRKYSSISGSSGAYNLLTPLISDAKTPFSLTTTYTNFYLPLGFTDGTTTVKTAKSGMVDLSSIIPTATSDLTNDSGFITSIPTATSSTLGMVQPDNTTITIDSNGVISLSGSTRNVGEVITSTLPLTDAGLHLLDGTLLQYGIYKEFIDYIADLYAENPTANYFTDETTWQASVTQYGSCGKFVYDSVNNTVRLPKVTGIIEGTTDLTALGDLVEAGLPNITGTFCGGDTAIATGAFTSLGNNSSPVGSGSSRFKSFDFDASRSSSIYGNSTTVQPQTIKVLYYIVIATSTKTDIQVDIDEIATDLNNKAGTDLANVTDTGKVLMSEMGMPSDTYIDLTLGASGSNYTAPANGWFVLAKASTGADQWITMSNLANDISMGYNSHASGNIPRGYLPCKKGDVIRVQYNLGGAVDRFRFVYAQGAESEAS